MTVQDWLETHPYLESIARFEQLIDDALASAGVVPVPAPPSDLYVRELREGKPLLLGEACPDLSGAADSLRQLAEMLAKLPLPDEVSGAIIEFRDRTRESDDHALTAIASAISPEGDEQDYAAAVGLLAWHVLRRVLAPAIAELQPVVDVSEWRRPECPTCGALASLAEIVDDASPRRRRLACAFCQTTWHYKRIGCPYCGNESPQQLSVLQIEEEANHRIDVCEKCHGYVKTYTGSGGEAMFLADWPTVHLDMIARESGYQRLGATLYDVA